MGGRAPGGRDPVLPNVAGRVNAVPVRTPARCLVGADAGPGVSAEAEDPEGPRRVDEVH